MCALLFFGTASEYLFEFSVGIRKYFDILTRLLNYVAIGFLYLPFLHICCRGQKVCLYVDLRMKNFAMLL
jgi:hypothetical protein